MYEQNTHAKYLQSTQKSRKILNSIKRSLQNTYVTDVDVRVHDIPWWRSQKYLTFSFEKYAEDIADEKSPDIGWMEYPDYVDPGNNSLSYNPTEFCGESIACKIKVYDVSYQYWEKDLNKKGNLLRPIELPLNLAQPFQWRRWKE